MPRNAATALAEPQTTRDVILDAAERRFAERGYAGTAVRDIAADAGLRNQASLYHYFRNKKAIYEAVLARGVDALVPLWSHPGGRRRTPATLAADLDRLLDYLAVHTHLARLIERAGLEEERAVRGAVARLLRPLYIAGLRALEEAGGPWQPAELPHLAAGIYHLVFGYFANAPLLAAVLREDPQAPAMLARQRRFVKAAVLRLLSDAPPPRLVRA